MLRIFRVHRQIRLHEVHASLPIRIDREGAEGDEVGLEHSCDAEHPVSGDAILEDPDPDPGQDRHHREGDGELQEGVALPLDCKKRAATVVPFCP
ncbi:hypothetical protein LBMAG42_05960 [Deltaproteobacteria bacterium]|nr:hypothetical protein LBMAG42_05960 [Deltaproteobacteria bacterium]